MPTVSLADFAAEVAVECGLTLSQVVDYSPAQLKMLRRAACRLRADNLLGHMNASYAAFAAVMAKGGRKVFEKMLSELKRLSGE